MSSRTSSDNAIYRVSVITRQTVVLHVEARSLTEAKRKARALDTFTGTRGDFEYEGFWPLEDTKVTRVLADQIEEVSDADGGDR